VKNVNGDRKKAEEIKVMLFRTPQPIAMRDAIKVIQSKTDPSPGE
jgi:hypothetical protein